MRTVLAIVAAALIASSVAHADPASSPVVSHKRIHWWGGEPLIADAAATAGLIGGYYVAKNSYEVGRLIMITGVTVYALGAPLLDVHLRHRIHGVVSFGARVAIPWVAGYTLAKLARADNPNPDTGLAEWFYGLVGGAALTAVVDDLGFTWEAVPYAAPAPSGTGATVGIAGAF